MNAQRQPARPTRFNETSPSEQSFGPIFESLRQAGVDPSLITALYPSLTSANMAHAADAERFARAHAGIGDLSDADLSDRAKDVRAAAALVRQQGYDPTPASVQRRFSPNDAALSKRIDAASGTPAKASERVVERSASDWQRPSPGPAASLTADLARSVGPYGLDLANGGGQKLYKLVQGGPRRSPVAPVLDLTEDSDSVLDLTDAEIDYETIYGRSQSELNAGAYRFANNIDL